MAAAATVRTRHGTAHVGTTTTTGSQVRHAVSRRAFPQHCCCTNATTAVVLTPGDGSAIAAPPVEMMRRVCTRRQRRHARGDTVRWATVCTTTTMGGQVRHAVSRQAFAQHCCSTNAGRRLSHGSTPRGDDVEGVHTVAAAACKGWRSSLAVGKNWMDIQITDGLYRSCHQTATLTVDV